MKKFTNHFKMLMVICALTGAKISVAQSPCQSSFTYSLGANGLVTFFGTAVGSSTVSANMYWWYFGNAGASASGTNMTQTSYTYPANGVYTVNLLYSNAAFTCSSSAVQTIVISNVTPPSNPCTLNANFTVSQSANGVVNFNNTSVGTAGGTTYNWSFGDASSNSTSTSPLHTYAANGVYVVTLVANNNFSYTCTDTQTMSIVVNSYCNLIANFSFTQNNGVVSFINTSTGVTVPAFYSWNFGDNTSSSNQSPLHTYTNGTYVVLLTVTNNSTAPSCSATVAQTLVVTTAPSNTCVANSNFSVVPTATAQYWVAMPAAPMNIVNAVWSWGDGNASNILYTSHTYSAAGSYDICLSVTVSCGASSTSCFSYAISKPSGTSEEQGILTINVIDPASTTGIKAIGAEKVLYTLSPNPSNGFFNLDLKGLNTSIAKINIYNVAGKLVYQAEAQTNSANLEKEVQLDQVPNGVYFVKVNSGNEVFTKKIIINKQ